MFIINGILKSDVTKKYTKKDGTEVEKRIAYIEPKGSIFPLKVAINDLAIKLGQIGHEVVLDIDMYPFYFENGQMKRAQIVYYMPKS